MTIEADTLMKALTLLLAAGSLFYTWVMSQGKAHEPKMRELAEKLDEAATKLGAAEGRIAKLEGEMKHMPDQSAVHKLELAVNDVKAQMATSNEIVKRVERTMERVEAFLDEQRMTPQPVSQAQPTFVVAPPQAQLPRRHK